MSAEYELILMLDPEVAEERREEIAGNARQRIEGAGSLRHSDSWGTRKLAYELNQRNEADYRFYRFEAEPALLDDLDHTLKITDGILRFRLFKVDPRAPLIEPPAAIQAGASRPPRRDDRRGRGGPREDDAAPAAVAAETPSAPEAPVSPETPVEPAPEPAPAEPAPDAPAPDAPEEAPAADAGAPAEAPAEAEPAER